MLQSKGSETFPRTTTTLSVVSVGVDDDIKSALKILKHGQSVEPFMSVETDGQKSKAQSSKQQSNKDDKKSVDCKKGDRVSLEAALDAKLQL